MRGVFLQQPLEFRLEASGDEWHQGDAVPCKLAVKNHGSAVEPLTNIYLQLAYGDLKKVKQKAADALEPVAQAELNGSNSVPPGSQAEFLWTFQLDKHCPISDKAKTLFIVCGRQAGTPAGFMPVSVVPHPHIRAVIDLFESSYGFVLKGIKSQKGWLEAKLKPPAGKLYPTLEHITLRARIEDDTLQLVYRFHLKKLGMSGTVLGVTKQKNEFPQDWKTEQYTFPGGQINHEPLEGGIAAALEQVKSGF